MNLDDLTIEDLLEIAKEIDIKEISDDRNKLITEIKKCFKEYEEYNKTKFSKYKRLTQLGNTGKEGKTYLVKTTDDKEYAMKVFKKAKSIDKIKEEARLQDLAAEFGISPKIIDIDLLGKSIIMEKMDEHLYDIMKIQNGNITINQQKQLVNIFEKLDEAKVFQGDSNILNYMLKNNKIMIIDFGMAKPVDKKLITKLETDKPNIKFMNLGFIIKLKELKCPKSSYKHLLTHVSEQDKIKFGLA
jgi:tRNA A-37 threonylcarbamoyl transferase component Bud32